MLCDPWDTEAANAILTLGATAAGIMGEPDDLLAVPESLPRGCSSLDWF